MGWLFAVALGLQETPTRAAGGRCLRALPPIAAGHLASVAVVAAVFAVTASAVTARAVAIVGRRGAGRLSGLWRLLSAAALPLGRHAAVRLASSAAGRS